jgi:hypothetical protein
MTERVILYGAVEGLLDEVVLRFLIDHIGGAAGEVYGKKGKHELKKRLPSYNNAAKLQRWVILIDLDNDDNCVARYRDRCVANPHPNLCLRIVVREIEAWLLSDRERIAAYLSVPLSQVPYDPESLDNAKLAMVNLARQSRRREIRADMVPAQGIRRVEGNAYVARLIEFVMVAEARWRPDVAAQSSESLRRCLKCIRRLVQTSDQN